MYGCAGVHSCSYIVPYVLVCAVYLRIECLLFQYSYDKMDDFNQATDW